MRIVIGGAGEVGRGVAKALRSEGRDVVLIDNDTHALKEAQALDVLVLQGDASRREDLEEAKVRDAEVFIAATQRDEMNLERPILTQELIPFPPGDWLYQPRNLLGRRDYAQVDLNGFFLVVAFLDRPSGFSNHLSFYFQASEVVPYGKKDSLGSSFGLPTRLVGRHYPSRSKRIPDSLLEEIPHAKLLER